MYKNAIYVEDMTLIDKSRIVIQTTSVHPTKASTMFNVFYRNDQGEPCPLYFRDYANPAGGIYDQIIAMIIDAHRSPTKG